MVEVEGAGGVENAAEDAGDAAGDAVEDAAEGAAAGAAADVAEGAVVDVAVDAAVDVVAGVACVVVVADAGDAAVHAVPAEEDDSAVQSLVKGIEALAEDTTAAAAVAVVLVLQSGLVEPEVGTVLEAASEYVEVGTASPTSEQLLRESQLEEPLSHPSA